ncbi:MAG TPA: His/Gly/Thr/Pro-type tRNA ligase C-terminal domain-containing protein, partial [Eubacteriales bacterium]|nr:His/Gly/Thr/Pro-type tRNA ligase C-terminal domain-containing protein [Eubacteriales bacterium]
EDACKKIGENAPKITDYLCGDCKTHFEGVKAALKDLSIAFEVNPRIVRGLDYYTNTVFEFVSSDIGAQGTVCGGGRYNGLVESLGGKPTAAVGFGLGIERLLLTLENCGRLKGFSDTGADVYVAPAGAEQYPYAARLVYELRLHGVAAATDLMARSLKAQMKYADKNGAAAVLVIGEDEIKNNAAEVKFLGDGSVEKIKLDEAVKYFFKRKINNE